MNKLELIKKHTQDVLDTCPNYDNKMYIMEDWKPNMGSVSIMFDTFAHELKTVYSSSKGYYINGRSNNRGEGRIYLHEFVNPDGSMFKYAFDKSEYENKVVESKDKDKTEYYSNKEVGIGFVGKLNDGIYVYWKSI